MTSRIMIVIEGGAIQRILTNGSTEFFIFDKDNLENGELDELSYKEEGWGIDSVGAREFDENLTKEIEEWVEAVQENVKQHEGNE